MIMEIRAVRTKVIREFLRAILVIETAGAFDISTVAVSIKDPIRETRIIFIKLLRSHSISVFTSDTYLDASSGFQTLGISFGAFSIRDRRFTGSIVRDKRISIRESLHGP